MFGYLTGTVLAVNGYRKYYNIYHPKTVNLSQRLRGDGDGAFIGLDDSSSSESENEGQSTLYGWRREYNLNLT